MQRSNFRRQPSKRASVYLPDELHEILTEFAARKNASLSTIILAAIEDTYEDEIDIIAGEMGLAEYLANPEDSISIQDLIAKRRSVTHKDV
ncbi:MAG: DUF6290 family protein [Dehalococcoidia bacterium]|nr:DUF6290 family protein [Dehalococcoidia bacterium]